jgi:hypothetical protein
VGGVTRVGLGGDAAGGIVVDPPGGAAQGVVARAAVLVLITGVGLPGAVGPAFESAKGVVGDGAGDVLGGALLRVAQADADDLAGAVARVGKLLAAGQGQSAKLAVRPGVAQGVGDALPTRARVAEEAALLAS